SGRLAAEPLHALPWRGRPLVEHAPVAYKLDLPRPAVAAAPPRRVVQLAPASNLVHAEAELTAVADALRRREISLTRLSGEEADLRGRLAVDLLHYVGHAHADGWH